MNLRTTRRAFNLGGAALAARVAFVPSLGQDATPATKEPLRLGVIGPGKRGRSLMSNAFLRDGFRVNAVCDVDGTRLAAAKGLADERQGDETCFATTKHEELLARADIDAVVIATPDHWHAHQILDACKAGLHIYCEKPLTLNLREAQRVTTAVSAAGITFQTGSQQRTEFSGRFITACELVRAGRIGKLLNVNVGVGEPARACDLDAEELEPNLDWDRWLGPAPERPYNSELSPRGVHEHYPQWRRYQEYAGGGLADMGAHHFDIAQWGLGRDGDGPAEVHPPRDPKAQRGAYVVYDDGVVLTHGGPSGVTFIGVGGLIHVDRGSISSTPENLLADPLPDDAPRLPRPANHATDWLEAIRTGGQPSCPAAVGAGSVAICHLLNLAYRYRRPMHWDPRTWRFVDDEEANSWLDFQRRAGYALPHG